MILKHNLNHIYQMSFDKFCEVLYDFCNQTVCGIYMAKLRTKYELIPCLEMGKSGSALLKFYINDCWASYHKRSNEYVISQFDQMKSLSIIEHTSCIFGWITDECMEILERMKNTYQKNPLYNKNITLSKNEPISTEVIAVRKMITDMIRYLIDARIEQLSNNKSVFTCVDKCKVYEYKEGETFIV